jgi:hypothetical protein
MSARCADFAPRAAFAGPPIRSIAVPGRCASYLAGKIPEAAIVGRAQPSL